MRGGLDDALDRLARRDELRRRAAGETTGTPAVTDLVEAIAAVVGRHPRLEVTVGVEGIGEPTLLHFLVEDGVVQVNADHTVAARAAPASPRHADFDIDPDEPAGPPYPAPAAHSAPPAQSYDRPFHDPYDATVHDPAPASDQDTHRLGHDDRVHHDTGRTSPYSDTPYADTPYSDEPYADEPYVPDSDPFFRTSPSRPRQSAFPTRDTGPADRHPLAATPPPEVPPRTTRRPHPQSPQPGTIPRPVSSPRPAAAAPERPPMPQPLPEPIPLHVDREETEQAARRLAALLRDNPTLLRQSPHD